MTTLDLDALERAARAATPGPWNFRTLENFGGNVVRYRDGDRFDIERVAKAALETNADFIARANPAAILAFIAAHRALQKALRQAESIISYPVDRRIDPDGFGLRPTKDIRFGVEILRAARTKAGEPHAEQGGE